MIFSPSNASDVKKYYENTYVKFKELGEKILYIKRVTSEEVVCVDSNDEVFQVVMDEDIPYEMTYSMPHKGLFAVGDAVYQLQRIPARQWKKGITSENTRIVNNFTGKPTGISFSLLEAYTNKPKHVPLHVALSDKYEGRSGVVLSNRLWYSPARNILYADNKPIASYTPSKKVLYLVPTSRLFKPEILNLLKEDVSKTIKVNDD